MATPKASCGAASPPLVDLLFERARVGLCLVAPDDTVVRANGEWLGVAGFEAEQVIGKNFRDLFPDFCEFGRAVHEQARAGQTIRLPRGSRQLGGPEAWWEGSFSPVPMEAGIGILVTARDVTHEVTAQNAVEAERKRAEAALLRATAARAQQKKAEDEREQLRELTAALEQTNRHKDDFVAMLAHELRNPLAAMKGAAHLIRLRVAKGECVDRHLSILERQIWNSSRLLDDLLDIARITRQVVQLAKEIVRLDSVVASAVDSQQAVMERAGHKLRVSLPQAPVLLEADPTRLEQIVSNLLDNAAKYTPDGGRIELSAELDGKDAVIRVKDNGVGLPGELLHRAFDPFIRADWSLAKNKGGLGLGLTLVRKLAEMHGGSVEARSNGLGKGSEFIVRLPARPDLGAPTLTAAAAPARPKRHRRILLVEDNADAAELMAEHLMLVGHAVTVAHDGPSGLAAAERVHPEIALLDIGLPGLDGYEVARRLHARDGPVLVALSGYGQEEYKSRAREAGFFRHLTKPVDPDALERLIDELA